MTTQLCFSLKLPKFYHAHESPEGLLQNADSDSVGLGQVLRVWISNKFPGDGYSSYWSADHILGAKVLVDIVDRKIHHQWNLKGKLPLYISYASSYGDFFPINSCYLKE